jgi:hypothetical protein
MIERGEGRIALTRLGELHTSADRFQLFRSAQDIARIQREFMRFKDSEGRQKDSRARSLVARIERAESKVAQEHDDVGTANSSAWRSRRGLVSSCVLFAAQLANLAALALKPETFGFLPDALREHANASLAAAILALALFPIRDFVFVYRFNKVKEDSENVLGGLKNEVLAYLGTLKK